MWRAELVSPLGLGEQLIRFLLGEGEPGSLAWGCEAVGRMVLEEGIFPRSQLSSSASVAATIGSAQIGGR